MHPEDDNALTTPERVWDLTMNGTSPSPSPRPALHLVPLTCVLCSQRQGVLVRLRGGHRGDAQEPWRLQGQHHQRRVVRRRPRRRYPSARLYVAQGKPPFRGATGLTLSLLVHRHRLEGCRPRHDARARRPSRARGHPCQLAVPRPLADQCVDLSRLSFCLSPALRSPFARDPTEISH